MEGILPTIKKKSAHILRKYADYRILGNIVTDGFAVGGVGDLSIIHIL